MSTYNIIKLKNITPLHIGKGKQFYDSMFDDLLSDSLSAAIAAVRATRGGQGDDMQQFLDSFSLSSAFPYYRDQFFLPKPMGRIEVGMAQEHRKRLKKVKFVEKGIFEQLFLKGQRVTVADSQVWKDLILKAPMDEGKEIAPYRKGEVERVSIPREEGADATPFFFEYKYFSPDGGLYCLTDAKDGLLHEIARLFAMLGEEGIGSDKNVGGGHFEVETGTLTLADTTSHNLLLLSMYVPTEQELRGIDLQQSKYQLLLRGGYMAGSASEGHRHLLKKAIYMMQSSSVIHSAPPLQGRIVNLRNQHSPHDIFRSGKAFYIPIQIQQ